MRVAVIGAGSMGGGHARLLATLPGVDEVLVVDAVASRATALAEEIGGRALAHDAALDAADAVIVATPANLHAMTVDSAISRGLPVLCEKPLTNDLRSTTELVRRIEEAGGRVEVGFQRRHDPTYLAAHAQIVDGSAGRLHLLRLTAHDPQTTPRIPNRWLPNDAAPLFLHSWIHDFDFVRWLSGQEVVEVTADGSRHDDPRPDDPGDIETAVIGMRLSGGTLAILEATWLHPTGYDSRVELVADRVHFAMGLTDRTPATWLDGRAAAANEPWQGYLERLEAVRIAVAATRAYQQRRAVSLDEIPGLPQRATA